MTDSKIINERKKAVNKAWKREKELVMKGRGTRNWTQTQQREIIRRGRVKGFEGHHMKSVDGHNSKAGDPNNIQFLTRKEHLAAHKGNFRNNTNGKYYAYCNKTRDFGRYKAVNRPHKLSTPLNDRQIKYNKTRADNLKKAEAARAKARKTEARGEYRSKKPAHTTSKALSAQRSGAKNASKTTAHGSTKSKALAAARSPAAGAGKGKTSSAAKSASKPASKSKALTAARSGASASSGRSVSAGRGKTHGHK